MITFLTIPKPSSTPSDHNQENREILFFADEKKASYRPIEMGDVIRLPKKMPEQTKVRHAS